MGSQPNPGEPIGDEVDLVHRDRQSLAPQSLQAPCVSGKIKDQLVGPEGLPSALHISVVLPPAVFSVSRQGMSGGGKLGPDLVRPAGEQFALHQGEPPPRRQGAVAGGGRLAAGDGPGLDAHLFFGLIL